MQIVCPRCLTRNRVPEERLADAPVCGKCRAALVNGEPLALESGGFDAYIAGNDQPVLVDFWAQWCGPCKMMAPGFASLAAERTDVHCAKVDTDANEQLSARFGIRSIPTLILFHHGREIARRSGALQASQLRQWLAESLGRQGDSPS